MQSAHRNCPGQPVDQEWQFRQLSTVLKAHEALWRPAPFCLPLLPWESQYPALTAALAALCDRELAALEADHAALPGWLAGYIPGLSQLESLQCVPALAATHCDYPPGFERDIPGRKWQQVTAFTACLDQLEGSVLDWCAGKAHLGRAVCQRFGTPVTALEWNPELCASGNAMSRQLQLDVRLERCDVLSAPATCLAGQARHAVALHACGDLHRRLLELVAAGHVHSLHLSPCCYHLIDSAQYHPFSQAGRDCGLNLSRDECRLAVQETVTASAAAARRREKKSAWRLGFDALQRRLRGADEYLPVPSIPDAIFAGSFADFCRHAAALKALAVPTGVDWPNFEQQGWQRLARVSRMELPRHCLRRALELWLVLDRALFLGEQGYRVNVGTFCERRLTPRNLMIRASRH